MDPMTAVPAEAFKLAREGQDVMIDFGRLDGVPVPAGLISIAVSDRVTLKLETARRLLVWLDDALKPHAARMRAEQAKAMVPAAAAVAARPDQTPQRPQGDVSGERAAQLLRMVGAWGVPHQYERSLRLTEGGLQANRFLLTVNASDIPGGVSGAAAQALAVCDHFEMPAGLREAAVENFPMARCVHFGFEGSQESIVCKLYLEREVSGQEADRARAANQPVLLHLAFKWDLLRDAAVTTRYLWYPFLSAGEIEDRLAHVYRDGLAGSQAIARALLRLAIERAPAERLQYLEVEEAENARRSFDLNVYNSKLQVKDIHNLLQQMREAFAIRPGQFQALYDQIKGMALGHLAGGVHRNGKDFFNLYYGAVGLPKFNDQLR
jgi:tryptophan halogenase